MANKSRIVRRPPTYIRGTRKGAQSPTLAFSRPVVRESDRPRLLAGGWVVLSALEPRQAMERPCANLGPTASRRRIVLRRRVPRLRVQTVSGRPHRMQVVAGWQQRVCRSMGRPKPPWRVISDHRVSTNNSGLPRPQWLQHQVRRLRAPGGPYHASGAGMRGRPVSSLCDAAPWCAVGR